MDHYSILRGDNPPPWYASETSMVVVSAGHWGLMWPADTSYLPGACFQGDFLFNY